MQRNAFAVHDMRCKVKTALKEREALKESRILRRTALNMLSNGYSRDVIEANFGKGCLEKGE